MAEITPENIRNVVLLSHSGAGKTSLAEALLFATGAIPRLGRVGGAAAGGVEVGTEEAWKLAQEAGLPRLIFINKMDRENAAFPRTLESIRERLGPEAFPLQVPLGAHT